MYKCPQRWVVSRLICQRLNFPSPVSPSEMLFVFVGHLLVHRELPHADFVRQSKPLSESAGDAVTLRNTAQQPDDMP